MGSEQDHLRQILGIKSSNGLISVQQKIVLRSSLKQNYGFPSQVRRVNFKAVLIFLYFCKSLPISLLCIAWKNSLIYAQLSTLAWAVCGRSKPQYMPNINLTVILKFSIICLIKIILYSNVVIGTVIAVACWTYDSVVFPKFVIT